MSVSSILREAKDRHQAWREKRALRQPPDASAPRGPAGRKYPTYLDWDVASAGIPHEIRRDDYRGPEGGEWPPEPGDRG